MLHKIADVINTVIEHNYVPNDEARITSIELLRNQLLKNTKEKIGKITISQSAKKFSIPGYPWGELLFNFVKSFKPDVVIELGTCIGISGAYLTAGLESNNRGKLFTVENFPPLVPFAKRNLDALGYKRYSIFKGEVKKVLDDILLSLSSIDMVFDDHIHKEKPVLDNFDKIFPFLADTALYMFDDIEINESMKRAWEHLKKDKRINITISLALGIAYPHRPYRGCMPRIGLAVILKKSKIKRHYDVTLTSLNSGQRIGVKHGGLVVIG